MAYDTTKLVKLAALKSLAEKINSDFATKEALKVVSDKVEGLEAAGGEPNTIEHIRVNGVELTIQDGKIVNITVPTKVSDLTNDSKFQTENEVAAAVAAADHMKRKIVANTDAIDLTADDADQYIYMVLKSSTKTGDKYDEYMVIEGVLEKVGDWAVDLSNYVQKEDGKGLSTNDYTTAEKEKLAGIAENANNYTHPAYTPRASGLYKVTVDATGHVSVVAAVKKADITALGIPEQDTTYSPATAEANGLMAAADKEKLDGISIASDVEVGEMLDEVFTTTAQP